MHSLYIFYVTFSHLAPTNNPSTGEESKTWMDRAFLNEINALSEATAAEYSRMCYIYGIHRAWFDMIIVRDFYRYVMC